MRKNIASQIVGHACCFLFLVALFGCKGQNTQQNNSGQTAGQNRSQSSAPQNVPCPDSTDEAVSLLMLGHVDHGKTTLVSAMTKVLSKNGLADYVPYDTIDAAPEVNADGLAISRSEVRFNTQKRSYKITDLPGHADVVKTMVSGCTQMDGAILVVAATDGPMPQTREHILLARQVGVPSLVVFMSKLDGAQKEPAILEHVELETRKLLSRYGFAGKVIPIIRGSAKEALKGNAEWEKSINKLIDALDNSIPVPVRRTDKPFLMLVKEAIPIQGEGTAATGKVEQGTVPTIGEEVEVIGSGPSRKAVVTAVETSKNDSKIPLDSVRVVLRGVESTKIERGQIIAKPGSVTSGSYTFGTRFKAVAYLLTKEEGGRTSEVVRGYEPTVNFQVTDVRGKMDLPKEVEMVMPGDNVQIQVNLASPTALKKGLRFKITENGRIVGMGTVTELF